MMGNDRIPPFEKQNGFMHNEDGRTLKAELAQISTWYLG